MKVKLSQLKEYLPNLDATVEELAVKLSLIGHESDVIDGETLEVKLTSNRKDCQDLRYLAFDVAALYPELGDSHRILKPESHRTIKVTLDKVNKILGSNVSVDQYQELARLGFKVEDSQVGVPDFRLDIVEGADVAEEVFRLVGVKAIKIEMLDRQPERISPEFDHLNNIRFALSSAGATETRTTSFSDRGQVELKNPFSSNLPYLQSDLLDGLLETLAKNPFSRRNIFFEIADVFLPEEKTHLAIVISGYKNPANIVERISTALGKRANFQPVEESQLTKFSVKQPNVYYYEVDTSTITLESLSTADVNLPMFKKISQFPPLVRDISISSLDNVGMGRFLEEIANEFPELHLVEQVDTYTDPQTGRVTDTYRFIFQRHDESFTAEQINDIDERLNRRFFGKA